MAPQKQRAASTAPSKTAAPNNKPSLIVFGLDAAQQARAGWFNEKEAAVATKAAAQLGLQAWRINVPLPNDLSREIAKGSPAASGYMIIPKVKQTHLDQLIKIIVLSNGAKKFLPDLSDAEKTFAKKFSHPDTAECERQLYASAYEKSQDRLPDGWSTIKPGSFVISQYDSSDAWYEALVLDRVGNMLSIRWRDYPKYPPALRHCAAVALLNPQSK